MYTLYSRNPLNDSQFAKDLAQVVAVLGTVTTSFLGLYLQAQYATDRVSSLCAALGLAIWIEALFDLALSLSYGRPRRFGVVTAILVAPNAVAIALGPDSDGRFWSAELMLTGMLVGTLWGSDRLRRFLCAIPSPSR